MHITLIGSGITGSAAALLLARQGHQVCVLEQCAQPAPLLRGFVRDGLFFDTGFHFAGGLQQGGVLLRWLNALDIPICQEDLVACRTSVLFPDAPPLELPAAVLNDASFPSRFPGYESSIRAVFRNIQTTLDKSPFINPSCKNLPGFGEALLDPLCAAEQLRALPSSLKRVLHVYSMLFGVPAEQACWKDFSMVAGPYLQGCYMLKYGARTLLSAIHAALDRAGISIRLRSRVTHINVKNKQVVGVTLQDGSSMPTDACIYTGHPQHLTQLLPEKAVRPSFTHRIQNMPETPQPFLLFAETTSSALDNRAIYLLPSKEKENIFVDTEASDASVFLSAGTPLQDGRRPVTAVSLILQRNLEAWRYRPDEYRLWKQHTIKHVITRITRALPELTGVIKAVDTATGLTYRHLIPGSSGSLYGLAHQLDVLPLLPLTRINGLLLAGQHILLPGILGGIVSAAVASGFICGHENILAAFRKA